MEFWTSSADTLGNSMFYVNKAQSAALTRSIY